MTFVSAHHDEHAEVIRVHVGVREQALRCTNERSSEREPSERARGKRQLSERARGKRELSERARGKRARARQLLSWTPVHYTAREKYCSTLASCAMCEDTCLKTMKWSGKRKRMSLKWLTMPSLMYGWMVSGARSLHRSISTLTGSNWKSAARHVVFAAELRCCNQMSSSLRAQIGDEYYSSDMSTRWPCTQ